MRKFLLVCILTVVSISCFSKDWLIMVYIGADNNLCAYLNADVDEMEAAYTDTSNMDIVFQTDGMGKSGGGYSDLEGTKLTDARRYKLSGNGNGSNNIIDELPIVKLGEINSGIPQSVVNFVVWAKNNYPADHYALVMWDHGAGWAKSGEIVKGGIWDDTDGSSFLSGAQGTWRQALKDSRDSIGENFAFIGHDMCVMSYMEVVWDEYDITDMIVISEANVPGYGWNYNEWIAFISQNPDASLIEIGESIVDAYAKVYPATAATMTYMLMDNTEMETLKNQIFLLAAELVNNNGGRDDVDVQICIDNALPMSSGTFYEDFKDLWDLCNELTLSAGITSNAKTYASNIMTIIDNLNPYDWQYGFSGSHGLGIYLPDTGPSTVWGSSYNSSSHRWFNDCWPWYDFISGAISTKSNLVSISCNENIEGVQFNIESVNGSDYFEIYRDNIFLGKTLSSFTDKTTEPGKIYEYSVFNTAGGYRNIVHKQKMQTSDIYLSFSMFNRALTTNKINSVKIADISGRIVYYKKCIGETQHDLSKMKSGRYNILCDGIFRKSVLLF